MSRLTHSLDDSALRSQLVYLKHTVDDSSKHLIDKISNLPGIKLFAFFLVYTLKKAKIIQVAEELGVNRRTAGRYLEELNEKDNLLDYELQGAVKIFFVLHESTKIVFDLAIEAVKLSKLNDHEQNGTLTKEFVNFDLDNTDKNETATDSELSTLVKIRQFYQKIESIPPTGRTIFYLLDDTRKSTKDLSQQIGCDNSTVSKYLKKFFDLGIADRETTSPYGAGRGEYFYFLNPVVSRTLLEEKNKRQMLSPPIELKMEDNNHANKQNTAVSTSNEKICQDSERMNTESFQQPSGSQSVDKNADEGLDPLAHKIKEFIKLTDQIERIEQELRDLLGPGKETEIAITRLKFKKI
ncbi:hypothetical protein [Nostoc sp.]|uniref:hypothetical protein n=1 Tax=Nostoc sp. TaxID=1180 RepID=UPI002FF783E0